MRVLSLLVSGLAFLVTAADAARESPERDIRRIVQHRNKYGFKVCRYDPAEVPLIPDGVYISADQGAHLVGLAKGISRDVRSIGNRALRGRLQRFWKKTRQGWDMMATCFPTPYRVDIQHYINVRKPLLVLSQRVLFTVK